MWVNRAKAKLQAGESIRGVFINLDSIQAVELCGLLGFDFCLIDAEHAPFGPQYVEQMIRAADVSGMTPLVRVAQNERQVILRYLDVGAQGVQIPMVNTAAQAQAVVEAVKYTPLGKRGLASVTRASRWGVGINVPDYVARANEETMVIVQVETQEALDNLDAILAVPHIDLVFVGPTDLSQSFGVPGQPTHPRVVAALEAVLNDPSAGRRRARSRRRASGRRRTARGHGGTGRPADAGAHGPRRAVRRHEHHHPPHPSSQCLSRLVGPGLTFSPRHCGLRRNPVAGCVDCGFRRSDERLDAITPLP